MGRVHVGGIWTDMPDSQLADLEFKVDEIQTTGNTWIAQVHFEDGSARTLVIPPGVPVSFDYDSKSNQPMLSDR